VGVENTADEQTRQSEAVADFLEEGAGGAQSRRGNVLSDEVIHNATNDLARGEMVSKLDAR
jgi:hypothetical protein